MTQAQALEILKTGKNVLVTGPAGSGKTHLLNAYIQYLKEHEIDAGVTASTGIAATHMGGMTIHSWAGIGIHSYLSDEALESMAEKSYLSKRFDRVRVLIIDEVSMLHHFRFDMVDSVLKAMKGNSEPFGGIQVVLCGDFFQLPPVARSGEPESHFIYKSEAWRNGNFSILYLDEQFRQKDDIALSILSEIRMGSVSQSSRKHLESRFNVRTLTELEPTKLFTHNIDVDTLNDEELENISGEKEAVYRMEATGRDHLVEALKKSCLAPERLRLKFGARVMCVKNNFEAGYANGTLGVVVSCGDGRDPVIRTASGDRITIERASWAIEEDGKVKAEISQYPLRLAWAITVHKSQGMSLDAVEVDLSKSFEPGMGYVALSRVRTLDGLTLLGLNEMALRVRDDVLEYDERLQQNSKAIEEEFAKMPRKEIEAMQKDFLDFAKPEKKKKKLAPHEETAELLKERKTLSEIAKERGITQETVVAHIEKILNDGIEVDMRYLKYEVNPMHWKKIEKAIEELVGEGIDDIRLSPVKSKAGSNISYLNIRLARALLGYAPKE